MTERDSLFDEGKIREITAALPPWPTAPSFPILAKLAGIGEGPRFDVIAHGLLGGDALAFGDAIRALVAVGAPQTAALYVAKRADEEGRAAGERALAAPPDVPLRDMHRLPDDALRAFAEHAHGVAAIATLRLLAGRALAARDFGGAAALYSSDRAGGSAADLAPRCRLDGALSVWASGDRGRARSLFAELDHVPPGGFAVLAPDDRELFEGKLGRTEPIAWRFSDVPKWDDPAAAAEPKLQEQAAKAESAGLLAAALRRGGVAVLRVELEAKVVASALEAGALVLVEEERSMKNALRIVLGVAEADELLLVRDPDRHEAALVPVHWQKGRSWLMATSALVVCGSGDLGKSRREALLAKGVVESPRLLAFDLARHDEDGEPRTAEATIARLRAVAKAEPTVPLAHARIGELLLEGVRRDQVKRDELTAWYAEVRERFPSMEMPSQTYAAYLEQYGSAAEAGIAWASAFHRDRFDARNAIGWGRSLKRMGKIEAAYARFRDASRLDPNDPYVYGWFSTCHYGRGENELAELAARISAELLPSYRSARTLLADALEAQGRATDAEPVLREAWEIARLPEDGVRLVRAGYRGGSDLDAAKTLAVEVAKRAGGESWGDAIMLHVASGDDETAAELARTLVRGQRPQGWPMWFVDGATTLAKDEATATARLGEASEALARDLVGQCDLALELAGRGQWSLALPLLTRIQESAPDNPNASWTFVRAALRARRFTEEREAVRAACKRLVDELAPGFVPLRAIAAAVELGVDPKRALEVASHPSFRDDPKSWLVSALALQELGDAERAHALTLRLAALEAGTLSLVADFYRFYELWDLPRATLSLSKTPWNDEKYLSLEHVAIALHDRRAGFFAEARSARTKWDWIPVSWLCAAALRAGDRAGLVEEGNRGASVVSASSASGGDPWVYRAFAAAAQGGEARATLLERLPTHPWVRGAFVLSGEAFGDATAAEDRARLTELCPVSHAAVLRRWEGP